MSLHKTNVQAGPQPRQENSASASEKKASPQGQHKSESAPGYDEAETNYKPKTLKFWTIMLGTYLSIFIVALVRLDKNFVLKRD
jgi:hypothetical protein